VTAPPGNVAFTATRWPSAAHWSAARSAERDKAWKRIRAAAKRFDVEVSESDWRDLAKGGKDRKR
jgi:hypothetical protein